MQRWLANRAMARLTARDIRRLSPEAKKQVRQALRSSARQDAQVARSNGEEATSKYRNIRTTVDGISFASRREARRYAELCIQLQAGEIQELVLQKSFSLDINGIHICDYIADFVYRRDGAQIVEDAKGKRLELYRIKKLLMKGILGIDIMEV